MMQPEILNIKRHMMSLLMLRNIQDILKGNRFPMASRGMNENEPSVGTISLAKNR